MTSEKQNANKTCKKKIFQRTHNPKIENRKLGKQNSEKQSANTATYGKSTQQYKLKSYDTVSLLPYIY